MAVGNIGFISVGKSDQANYINTNYIRSIAGTNDIFSPKSTIILNDGDGITVKNVPPQQIAKYALKASELGAVIDVNTGKNIDISA